MKVKIALASGLVLASCATVPELAPAGPFQADSDFTVTLNEDWTVFAASINPGMDSAFLTMDGPQLNAVYLASIQDGEGLVTAEASTDVPQFISGSSMLEIVEFLTASLTRLGYSAIETKDVRPHSLDGVSGTRLGLDATRENGLSVVGEAAFAEDDRGLHIVIFLAPRGPYHTNLVDDVDELISSIRLNSSGRT
ncbi:MAG: hypothetical protein AAFX03_10825 [Pseudomonadota bacterium]